MEFYEPRQKSKFKDWKFLIPVFAIILIVMYLVIGFLLPSKDEVNKFTVCGLNGEETVKKLSKTYDDVLMVKDYFYYGESLNLYEDMYGPEIKDTLSGKTVELKNICNNKTISMTIENKVDQKIILDDIEPGFYEVYIVENLVSKRVAFDKPLKENTFTTAQRNGKVNRISLIADKNLLKDDQKSFDYNYLFLQVRSEKASADEVDVMIDPYGMNTDYDWMPDEGIKANGLIENDELFEAAEILKKELEDKYGLRVGITKEFKDEIGRAYGDDGRIAKGYKQNAKYYIFLKFDNDVNKDMHGILVSHSHYVSNLLARNIAYGLEKELNMTLSAQYFGDTPGISNGLLLKGKDGKLIYDDNLYLRESGGRATFAAKFSDKSEEQNASFKDLNGMNGIEINLGYLTNKNDANFWKENKEKIMKQIALSFAEGINASNTNE